MTPSERKKERLDRLVEALREKPMTARQVAERFKISIPIAYEWIEAITDRGESVVTIHGVRRNRPGPKPVTYGIQEG